MSVIPFSAPEKCVTFFSTFNTILLPLTAFDHIGIAHAFNLDTPAWKRTLTGYGKKGTLSGPFGGFHQCSLIKY